MAVQSREIMYHRLNINRIMAGYCSQPIEKVSVLLALQVLFQNSCAHGISSYSLLEVQGNYESS